MTRPSTEPDDAAPIEGWRPAPTPVHAFFEGFAAPLRGFRYLRHHPKLWPYAILPMVLTFILTVATLALLVWTSYSFISWMRPHLPDAWLGGILSVVAGIAVVLIALLLAMAAFLLLNAVICEYFRGKLAEAVEKQLGFDVDEINEVGVLYIIVDACHDVGFLAVVNIALLFLHLVPVIGSIAAVVGSFYFECITFGADYLDYPLAFRGVRRKQKREWIRRHRAHAVGLGAVTFPCTFVPFLSSIILTGAAVGAVLLYRQLAMAEEPT